jgi:GT2 family glycosyltransferase
VVIPVYNQCETLGACLESALAQSIAHELEIIVVDDGSTDRSLEVAERYPVTVKRRLNGGPGAARNTGARLARGDVVLFLDADCQAPPDWAERMLAAFDDPATVAAMGTLVAASAGPLPLLVQAEIEERYARLRDLQSIDFLASPSCAVRRGRFVAIGGFREDFRYNEDVELAYRLEAAGGAIRLLRGIAVAHAHPTSWRAYLESKFWRGVWRMRLYRLYPRKALQDDWTPQTLKLQIAASCALVPQVLVAPFVPAVAPLIALTLGFILLSGRGLLGRAWRLLAPKLGLASVAWAALFLVLRGIALAVAVSYGSIVSREPARFSLAAREASAEGVAPKP